MSNSTRPALADVIRFAGVGASRSLRVMVPARVTGVDRATNTVDVQVLLREISLDPEDADSDVVASVPALSRVPITYLRWGGFVIRVPVAVGDRVTLLVSDRSLDEWLSGNGQEVTPEIRRAHDINDAVALAGFDPFGQVPAVVSATDSDLVIGREDGAGEVRVAADGSIRLGAREASHRPVARQDDGTVVDNQTDPRMMAFINAVYQLGVALAGVGPASGAGASAAFIGAVAAAGGLPTQVTGRITSGSGTVEVE